MVLLIVPREDYGGLHSSTAVPMFSQPWVSGMLQYLMWNSHTLKLSKQRKFKSICIWILIFSLLFFPGEIARLEHRFKVSLDDQYHNGSKTVHLICRLEDKHLPSVPPLEITVPENYPESSPICSPPQEQYSKSNMVSSLSTVVRVLHLKWWMGLEKMGNDCVKYELVRGPMDSELGHWVFGSPP